MFYLLTSSTILALANSVDIDSIRQDIAAHGRKLFASSTAGSNARRPHGRNLFMATYDCAWSWADNTCNPSNTLISSSFGTAGDAITSAANACGYHTSEDACKAGKSCKWNKSECQLNEVFVVDTLFDLNYDSCGDFGKFLTKNTVCGAAYSNSAQCPTDTCTLTSSGYSYNADTKKCVGETSCNTNAAPPSDRTVTTDDDKCEYLKSLMDCSAIQDTTKCSGTDAKCVKEDDCTDDGSTAATCGYAFSILGYKAFLKPEFQSSWDKFVTKASKCDTMKAHSACESSETLTAGAFQVGISTGIVTTFAVLMLTMF